MCNKGLIPYLSTKYQVHIFNSPQSLLITYKELAHWLEKISCKNQLIISEAGSGPEFRHRAA